MYNSPEAKRLLGQIRFWMALFLIGLVLSGVTAFPLNWEIRLMARMLGMAPDADPAAYTGMLHWIALVQEGIVTSDARYRFLAYGTDWLAFAHIAIAVFFTPVLRDPVRNSDTLCAGLAVCALVLLLAVICGPIRGIPFFWQLIDCSFGVAGAFPIILCLNLVRRIEEIYKSSHTTHDYRTA